jgi:cytochrome c
MTMLRQTAAGLAWWLVMPLGCHGPAAWAAEPAIDVALGQAVYETHCMRCHSIGINDVGPRHQGVVGRQAGSVSDYVYSAALKGSKVVWTEDMLDRWLTDPEALIPGQEMDVQLTSAEDRRVVIAYLKVQRGAKLK